jgi:hypothetical protein
MVRNIKDVCMYVCVCITIATHFQALSYSNQFTHVVINLYTVVEECSIAHNHFILVYYFYDNIWICAV